MVVLQIGEHLGNGTFGINLRRDYFHLLLVPPQVGKPISSKRSSGMSTISSYSNFLR